MEEVESRLRNLYKTYTFNMRPGSKSRLSYYDNIRFLGGMESLLQTLGKIPSGILWDFKVVEKRFLNLIPYKSTENYKEFILRHCEELITDTPNTPCRHQ